MPHVRPSGRRCLAAAAAGLLLAGGLVTEPAAADPVVDTPSAIPTTVATVDTSAGGGGARPLLGDITGDGRLDIVMMQPDYSTDDRFIGHQVQALTAYDLTGGQLWQVGTPDPRVVNSGSDIPAEIYDFDGDGFNDVLAVMDDQLRVIDGRTAAVKKSFALPDTDAHDTLIIANFRGTDRPRDIVVKDRYDQLWALDENGQQLWTHVGNPGHRPYPHDFDDDGRQELIGGYDFLNPDGQRLWTADMADHADSLAVGDINGDGIEEIAYGGAGQGGDSINVYTSAGVRVWQNFDTVEAQQIAFGDFRPDLPGLETFGLDRIDRTPATGKDGLFLIDSSGRTLWKEERDSTTLGCWGTAAEPLHNWAGDYADLIVAWNRGCGASAAIYDGYGKVVTTFPIDGRIMRGDLCGDDRGEVVSYVMGQSATVYASGPCDLAAKVTGRPLPQSKRLYNYSRYTAEEIPADLARGHRAGASSAVHRHAPARAVDGDAGTAWLAARGDRRPQLRVDLGRLRELTGYTVQWQRGARPHSYRVEVSVDGRRWTAVTAQRRTTGATDRYEFTGLGRYVRLTGMSGRGPVGVRELQVLGTR